MYEQHFGLKEKPFNITPDADFLFLSEKHKAALAMLEYGVFEQTGITVITGEIGAGKTTLIRHLLGTVPFDQISVGLVSNVHSSLGSLLQWVAIALELHTGETELTNMQAFRRMQDHLVREYAEGRRVVLVIDEAQNMNGSSLEELRMLININTDKNQLLQIVLIGQPELLGYLQQSSMTQLAQRVTAEYHLEALTCAETKSYIASRLETAGAESKKIFSNEAIEVIYYFSGGIPRLINTLSDHALVLAYGMNEQSVSFEMALETVKQKRIGGIRRHGSRPHDADCVRELLKKKTGVDLGEVIEDE